MKRGWLILCLLLLGCRAVDSAEAAPVPALTLAPVATVLPVAVSAPSATPSPTPSPTPTPSPQPTPEGLLGGRYDGFVYGDPVRTDTEFRSEQLSLTLSTHTDNPYSKGRLVYYVADIHLQDITLLRTAAAADFLTDYRLPMKTVAQQVHALLAVNGDFTCGRRDVLIVRNGVVEQTAMARNRETCLLYRDGTIAVFTPQTLAEVDPPLSDVWQAWQFGPYLINEDGTPRTSYSTTSNLKENPRTALGYYEPGHYCFVVVDGRQRSHSVGLTMPQLAQLMVDLGCTQAFNLDGGATSQLYWQGQIYNQPDGNRNQLDILYFADPAQP